MKARSLAIPARERGLAMVEFVVSVPLLLLLLFGSFEFGNLMIEYNTLNDAVRNASRYLAGAALSGTDSLLVTGSAWTTLVANAQKLAVYGIVSGTGNPLLPSLAVANFTVTKDTTTNNITVVAAYPYRSLFGGGTLPTFVSNGSLNTTYTLNISTTMRAL